MLTTSHVNLGPGCLVSAPGVLRFPARRRQNRCRCCTTKLEHLGTLSKRSPPGMTVRLSSVTQCPMPSFPLAPWMPAASSWGYLTTRSVRWFPWWGNSRLAGCRGASRVGGHQHWANGAARAGVGRAERTGGGVAHREEALDETAVLMADLAVDVGSGTAFGA